MFMEIMERLRYAPVPLLMAEGELTNLAKLYLRFLEEVPEEQKRQVHFGSPFKRGTASGYCDTRMEKDKDPKEYFQWTPDLNREPAYMELKSDRRYPSAQSFFASAESVYGQAEVMACKIFAGPMRQFYDRCFTDDGKLINGFLRILCYSPTEGPFHAKAHYDKGPGTLALLESSPGLRISCCAAHMGEPVRRAPNYALFMPGQLVWEDSKGKIIPAWHDVVPCGSPVQISKRCARYAVVFFINDKDGRYPALEATHRPLPVHEPFPAT